MRRVITRSYSVEYSRQTHLQSSAGDSDFLKYFRYVGYLAEPRIIVRECLGYQKVPICGNKSTRTAIVLALLLPFQLLLPHHRTSQYHQGFYF